MSIFHYVMGQRMKRTKRDLINPVRPLPILLDDNFQPADKKHWLQISLGVILVCLLGISFAAGYRSGRSKGYEESINFMMDQIHADLDQKCFDQLSKNMAKGS